MIDRDDIIRMAREAGVYSGANEMVFAASLERFAALVEKHLIASGYRKCAEGQRTTQFCGQLESAVAGAVAAERERIIAANAPEIERINAYLKARGEK